MTDVAPETVLPRTPTADDLAIVPVGDLRPHPDNPRKHDDDGIADSMRDHGIVDVCVVQRSTGYILGGNGRWENAQRVGAETVPVLYVDCDDAEAEEILMVLNAMNDRASYHLDRLNAAIERIRASDDVDRLRRSGWTDEVLERVRRQIAGRSSAPPLYDPEATFDSGGALRDEFGTEVGQLWTLKGNLEHRLLIADTTDASNVERLLGDEPIDLIVTSPPYNVGVVYEQHDDSEQPWDLYRQFLLASLRHWIDRLAPGRFLVWNVGVARETYHYRHVALFEDELGLRFWRELVWAKLGVNLPTWHHTVENPKVRAYSPHWTHELIFLLLKGSQPEHGELLDALDNEFRADVLRINQAMATRDIPVGTQRTGVNSKGGGLTRRAFKAHPAAFPLALPGGFAQHLADPGAVVFDPFVGAGSTLLACEQRGRRGAGVEISPEYAAVALSRATTLGMTVEKVEP